MRKLYKLYFEEDKLEWDLFSSIMIENLIKVHFYSRSSWIQL